MAASDVLKVSQPETQGFQGPIILMPIFSLRPAFPASRSFNPSCLRRLASLLELDSLVGSTTDHLSGCCLIPYTKDHSTMRAELAGVIANSGWMH